MAAFQPIALLPRNCNCGHPPLPTNPVPHTNPTYRDSLIHALSIMVEGGGFEPPKLARQIYSLIPLATREPLRKAAYCPDGSLQCQPHIPIKLLTYIDCKLCGEHRATRSIVAGSICQFYCSFTVFIWTIYRHVSPSQHHYQAAIPLRYRVIRTNCTPRRGDYSAM